MKPSREDILAAFMQLPEEERVALVYELFDIVECPADPSVDAAWAKEVERRIKAIDEGRSNLIPAEQVRRSIEQLRNR